MLSVTHTNEDALVLEVNVSDGELLCQRHVCYSVQAPNSEISIASLLSMCEHFVCVVDGSEKEVGGAGRWDVSDSKSSDVLVKTNEPGREIRQTAT